MCLLKMIACAASAAILCAASAFADPLPPSHVDDFTGRPRLVVLTDMGNEPDDQMSFVRLMVYSNEFDIEGLIATTSTWLRETTHPETMREIIAAYGEVRPNLMRNARGWPTAAKLASLVATGPGHYGMAGVSQAALSDGAKMLIAAVDRDDARPLWVTIWGGANTLAEALIHVRATRSADALGVFVAKLRVYAISDQDDAGAFIRREFPDLFYIVWPSSQDSEDYANAAWGGISGSRLMHGADFDLVSNEWLDANIRSKGPLGAHYPRWIYIMEGDTPSYLGLIENGLNSYRNPSWGGWGGRYVFRQPPGESHPIWTQGGASHDFVTGADGRDYSSDQATIWRWRRAYQHDFAARMDWTIQPFARANHNPELVVDGVSGKAPIILYARVGESLTLDASASTDPDHNALSFHWFAYREAGGASAPSVGEVAIAGAESPFVVLTPIATCQQPSAGPPRTCPADGVAHVILEVTDNGAPSLTSYRRIILNIHAAPDAAN